MKTETTIQANPKIQQSEKSQFRQYASYKPSNVEWLGDVPNHWTIERLKDVCENITSGGTPKTSIDIYWENGDIIWVTPTDFQDFEKTDYINNSRTKITAAGLKDCSASILPIGTVVMQSRASIGLAKISATELCTNQGFINFTGSYALNNKFLFYLINVYLGEYFQGTASGTTYMEIPRSKAKQEKIPLPPFTEQTAIAAYLDQATANIDKVITTKQKQLEKLEQYKQSKIHECVTGKHRLNLDLQDEKIKGLKSKNPGIQNISIQTKDSGIDWIGDVPGHWRKIKLRYEIEIQSGEFVSNTELEVGGDFPVFGGNGIMGYVSKFNIESERLIIGRVGAKCGNVHHVENSAWISDNALIVTTYHNYRYLFYLLTEMNLNSISSQSAQPLITGTKIKNEYVVLPPIGEQIEIAEYLNDFSQKISKEKSIIEQQIEKLKQYRKCLIHECVTGKRKVINE
jgi:type I restriction enzyme S subunit